MRPEIEIKSQNAMNYVNNKLNMIKDAETRGVTKATMFMQNEVKSSIAGHREEPTSVDTGRFLNSVNFEMMDKTGKVYTDIEYAKFLELGTSRMEARGHFTNSLERNRQKIKDLITQEIKNSI